MSKQYPNAELPMPDEYVKDMRNYLPDLPIAAIKDAWKHAATPMEVMWHIERVEGKA